ncbi:C40 family peptidase [Amycolatopsis sp. cmx-4-68]|uniref:C40 family peptidase n=1 Tax=Amycolatopsis sp. cmx-4-68 TaxID=2790938 RepID=UPI00397A3A7C
MAKFVTTCIVFVVVLMLAVAGGAVAVVQSVFGTAGGGSNCASSGATATSVAGYGPQQMNNAATIVAVGQRLNVPEAGWVVAIATAITESQLQNLDYGDRDSVGLFQQRPSQGWGTVAQIMDPVYSSEQFYRHLLGVRNWQSMTVTEAAQTVQRSGFPDRYGTHEQAAREIVGTIKSVTCAPQGTGTCDVIQAPNPVAVAAIMFACGQRGLPYLWGGEGPAAGDRGFDCSGLVQAAYAAAGIALPRTSRAQYAAGQTVPVGQPLQPGDLVFYATVGQVHHVGLYLGGGNMIDAPDFGQAVRVHSYRYPGDDYFGATRPVN